MAENHINFEKMVCEMIRAEIAFDSDSFQKKLTFIKETGMATQLHKYTKMLLLIGFLNKSDRNSYVKSIEKLDAESRAEWLAVSPILIAARYGDKMMCEWLLETGLFDVHARNSKNQSALHLAVENNDHAVELVPYFVSLGLDLNARSFSGKTPLHYALKNERLDIAEVLVQSGADLKVKIEQENLLHFCTYRDALESAKFTVKRDPDQLNERACGGMTALHIAVQWASREFVKWLVDAGIDKFAKTSDGKLASNLVQPCNFVGILPPVRRIRTRECPLAIITEE